MEVIIDASTKVLSKARSQVSGAILLSSLFLFLCVNMNIMIRISTTSWKRRDDTKKETRC